MPTGRLLAALTATIVLKSPPRMAQALRHPDGLRQVWADLDAATRHDLERQAGRLADQGVQVMLADDPDFPAGLVRRGRPVAPVLFFLGARDHFAGRGVGMCGSRLASDL